jgi:hypothetical protein
MRRENKNYLYFILKTKLCDVVLQIVKSYIFFFSFLKLNNNLLKYNIYKNKTEYINDKIIN